FRSQKFSIVTLSTTNSPFNQTHTLSSIIRILNVFQSPNGLSATFSGLDSCLLLLYKPPEPTCAPTSVREISQICTCGVPRRYTPASGSLPFLSSLQSTNIAKSPYCFTVALLLARPLQTNSPLPADQLSRISLSATACFCANSLADIFARLIGFSTKPFHPVRS